MESGAGPTLIRNLGACYLYLWLLYFTGSRTGIRDKVIHFAISTATFGIMCVVFEACTLLRIVDYRKVFSTRFYAPARNPDFLLDRELIYIRRPHRDSSGTVLGGDITGTFDVPSPRRYDWHMRFDQNGFRNPIDVVSAEIAVIGDSFVEGPNVGAKEMLPAVLAARLGRSVVNLGQIGYGPQQELAVLKRFGLPMCPSLVIWAFFEGNDLKNAREYETVRANWDAFVAEGDSFWQRSFVKNALQAVERVVGHTKPSARKRSCEVPAPAGRTERLYFLYPGAPLSSGDEAAIRLTGTALKEAARLTNAHGASLLLLFVPSKYRVFASLCRPEPGTELASWTVNDMPGRIAELVRTLEGRVSYLDLTPALRHSAQNNRLPYLSDDSHWSAEGHRVAAAAIIEHLSRQNK